MTLNLASLSERNLETTLEKYGRTVEYTGPDNFEGSSKGRVVMDRRELNPTSGEIVFVEKPVVILRRSTMDRIPQDGEKWVFKMPVDPADDAPLCEFILDSSKALRGGRTAGIIRVPLTFVKQLPTP